MKRKRERRRRLVDRYRLPLQPTRGELKIQIFRKRPDGGDHLEDLFSYLINNPENLVVYGARTIMGNAVTIPSGVNSWLITKMKLGSGGLGGGGSPREPLVTETDLANPEPGIDPSGWLTTTSAEDLFAREYTATLDYTAGNGVTYSEEGIFAENNGTGVGLPGTMFAIKTFSPLVKTIDWKFTFTHRILF